MKTKVLICGATGFIGRNIAQRLADRNELDVTGTYLRSEPYEYPGLKLVKADLTDPEQVFRLLQGFDIIIQAAATTSGAKDIVEKPFIHVTDNAVMNSLIFRAAYEHHVKHVVFFSCTVMYPSSDVPLKETDFDANREFYPSYFGVGWTKVYLEKMAAFYSRLKRTRYTVFRHSNIYGPFDKYDLERSHVFGATMTKVLTAPDGSEIVVWGSGEEERDLLYVDDLVSAVEAALERQQTPFELLNIGYGASIPIKELVAKIIAASGKKVSIKHDLSKPTLKTKLCLDAAKAEKTIDWKRQVSLESGIKLTMEWYRKNPGIINENKRKP